MTLFTPLRLLAASSLLALAAAALPACPGPEPEGADLFRLAVNGVPGGSLLSVWGPRAYAGSLWLAGGFVGVDPARLAGTGMSAGRLVEYSAGRFTTRCRANAVLWWAHGVERDGATPEVWAVGEGGTVLRYRDGACETLPLGITFAEGPPTFWGVWAESPTDVYLVGGSALPTGPKGVLVHYDGSSFTRITALPEAARGENLYKITRAASRYLVVGSGGTLLRVGAGGAEVTALGAPINSSDNRMFTVSCFESSCFAVGGVASGFVLRGAPGADVFPRFESLTGLSGLNGVHVQDAENVFVVGANGVTAHIATRGLPGANAPTYVSGSLTQATLHGVGGSNQVTLAVGGELDERTPMQRAVILARGDSFDRFTFDGREFAASGTLRRSLGGSGQ